MLFVLSNLQKTSVIIFFLKIGKIRKNIISEINFLKIGEIRKI
jgi:hypothetical protein